MFVEDLSVFFNAAEFAVAATWGSLSANVLFDSPSEDLLGGRAQGVAYEVLLSAADFPEIARGEEVSISGAAYVVREVRREGDGALKRLMLASST
jgi:hypothetical protein